MFLHLDCRHYLGDRPCKFNRPCRECPYYDPMGPRVLIIKLGALGDVVRTHALIEGLTQITVEDPFVTWLTAPAAVDLVKRMPGVHRVLPYTEESIQRLMIERFDWVLSLDKEPGPCAVAMNVKADKKTGMGLSRYGTVLPLNDEAFYYFELGLDNEEKFHGNRKSYQTLVYEAMGLEYAGQGYTLKPTEADHAAAAARFSGFKGVRPGPWVGLNPGAGGVFANKDWPAASYAGLVRELVAARSDLNFLLLGGAKEEGLLYGLLRELKELPVHSGGIDNALGPFMALIARCDVLVCGDTLAMHLAIAQQRRVVAMFGPTCEQEIDTYGRGVKVVTPIECAPCYLRACDKSPHCQDLIPVGKVTSSVLEQLALEEKR